MSTKWKSAFKMIHGKTPTKMDFQFAPPQVREELLGSEPAEPAKASRKRHAVRLKRPETIEHGLSPMAKRNRSHVDAQDAPTSSSAHPISSVQSPSRNRPKRMLFSRPPPAYEASDDGSLATAKAGPSESTNRRSPLKSLNSRAETNSMMNVASSSINGDTGKSLNAFTPTKSPLNFLSPMKSLQMRRMSPRKALFTPEKVSFPGLSRNSPRTPIRSPRKAVASNRKLIIPNCEYLLLKSTEKFPVQEEAESFGDETEELPESVVKEAPKPVKKLFKYNAKRAAAKANGENFVRINLRKKAFVRGKVSAEAKRKLVRKQKWKAKFGKRF